MRRLIVVGAVCALLGAAGSWLVFGMPGEHAEPAAGIDLTIHSPEDVPPMGFDPPLGELDFEEVVMRIAVEADQEATGSGPLRDETALVHAQPIEADGWRYFDGKSLSGRDFHQGTGPISQRVCQLVRSDCAYVEVTEGEWSMPEGIHDPIYLQPDDELVIRWVSEDAGATPPCEWLVGAGLWDGTRVVRTSDVRLNTCAEP